MRIPARIHRYSDEEDEETAWRLHDINEEQLDAINKEVKEHGEQEGVSSKDIGKQNQGEKVLNSINDSLTEEEIEQVMMECFGNENDA